VNLHLTSIIPLMVGLILLVIGLTSSYWAIVWIAAVVITYGILVHTNNVAVIRRAAYTSNRSYSRLSQRI
jgi:hypothetical protein